MYGASMPSRSWSDPRPLGFGFYIILPAQKDPFIFILFSLLTINFLLFKKAKQKSPFKIILKKFEKILGLRQTIDLAQIYSGN